MQALRGAAPSFGIVTSWTFATLPAPPTLINFNIYFPGFTSSSSSKASLVSILTKYQTLAPAMRSEMWMTGIFGNNGDGTLYFQFQGVYTGLKSEWNTTITPLLKTLPKGYTVSSKTFNYINSMVDIDGQSLDTSAPDVVRPLASFILFFIPRFFQLPRPRSITSLSRVYSSFALLRDPPLTLVVPIRPTLSSRNRWSQQRTLHPPNGPPT
jgi:hypothetical protein